jgi:hypothetical protein
MITHYKGNMICGFCPSSGSLAEKLFNRADVFKRHLKSVHAVEQTSSNSWKTSEGVNAGTKLTNYAPGATGKCSTCSVIFQNAQDFCQHLDDCVLRIVQQEVATTANNLDGRILADGLGKLNHNGHGQELETSVIEERKKHRFIGFNSGGMQKRTLTQSIGSDTDEEDLQRADINEAGSSERRLRRKIEDMASLTSGDAPQVILEVDESESGDDVVRNQAAKQDDYIEIQNSGLQSLPYYDIDPDSAEANSKSKSGVPAHRSVGTQATSGLELPAGFIKDPGKVQPDERKSRLGSSLENERSHHFAEERQEFLHDAKTRGQPSMPNPSNNPLCETEIWKDGLLTSLLRREKPRWQTLSEEQLTKLWWQTYKTLYEADPCQGEYLYDKLSTKLGVEKHALKNSDTQWSFLTLQLLKTLKQSANFAAELMTAIEKRDNAIKIVKTVSETLGLESAALAWSCIVCFLKVLPFNLSEYSF